jgi:hypothetical protein
VVARIFVRVKFHGELAVGFFDLLGGGFPADFQYFVIIAFGHFNPLSKAGAKLKELPANGKVYWPDVLTQFSRTPDNRWHWYWRVSEITLHLGCLSDKSNTNTHAIYFRWKPSTIGAVYLSFAGDLFSSSVQGRHNREKNGRYRPDRTGDFMGIVRLQRFCS